MGPDRRDPTEGVNPAALVQFKPPEQRGPMRPIGQHHSVGRCAYWLEGGICA